MKNHKWDEYFYSHYNPKNNDWSIDDLNKYRRWYKPWLIYIKQCYNLQFNKKNILELGCGIGAVSSLLHDYGSTVTGTDIAEIMIHHAKKVTPDIVFEVYDVMKPYKKKNVFDYVFAFEVLEHIPDVNKSINNIFTCLKNDGYFIGSTPYPYDKNMLDPTHVNVHPPEFWIKQFKQHGFTTVKTQPASFLPLLWKLPLYSQPVIPFYIKYPFIVSTTLIIAKK